MQVFHSDVLDPGAELTPTSRVRREQLGYAREVEGSLDLAVEKLRRGLRMKSCARPEDDHSDRTVVDAVMTRALLLAQDGKDPSPLVLDLLAMSRRLQRCGAGLLALQAGLVYEERARVLAEWAAHWGLLPNASRKAVAAAFARDVPNLGELERALDFEAKAAFAQLLPPNEHEVIYSRKDTEVLLAQKFDAIRKELARPNPDMTQHEKGVRALLSMEDKALLRAVEDARLAGTLAERAKELEQRKIPPNVIGRATVMLLVMRTGQNAQESPRR